MHIGYNITSDIFYLGKVNDGPDSGGIAIYHQRPLPIGSLDRFEHVFTRPTAIAFISGAKSTSPYPVKVKNGIPEDVLKNRDVALLKISSLEGAEFDSILEEMEIGIAPSPSRIPTVFR